MKEKQQVIIGEMIRIILIETFKNNSFVNKSFDVKYQYIDKERVIFILTSSIVNLISFTKTFLGKQFLINGSESNGFDKKNTIVLNLSEVNLTSLSKLNYFYRRISINGKKQLKFIAEEKIKEIIPLCKISKESNLIESEDFVLEEVILVKPEITYSTSHESKKMIYCNIYPHDVEKFKLCIRTFFSWLSESEVKFNFRKAINFNEAFFYENTTDCTQVLKMKCNDIFSAVQIEFAVRYFINGYRDKSVVRIGDKVIVSPSSFFTNKTNGVPVMGLFCLPPSDEADINEIKCRLHRVACLVKPKIEQDTDCFTALYQKDSTAIKVHNLISSMGWKSKIIDNVLSISV